MRERDQPASDGPRVDEDVMRIVFSHLQPPELSSFHWITDSNFVSLQRARRKTLFNAALTCRSFCYPALSILWSDLTELHPLLQLLHSSFESRIIEHFPCQYGIVTLLLGPIDMGQWERLRFYAKFVRRLEYERRDIDISVYERLRELLDDQPLLPNLRELWWKEDVHIHRELALFISCSLSVFHLSQSYTVGEHPKDTRSRSIEDEEFAMRTLLDRSQGLQEFQIAFAGSMVWPSAMAGVPPFPNLRTVRFFHDLPSFISYDVRLQPSIFSTPNLKCLNTDIFLPATDHSSPPIHCPTLESFICRGAFDDVHRTIQSFNSPNLRHISYVCHESLNVLSRFIQIVSDRFARTLREFRLTSAAFINTPLQQALDPLRQVSQLTIIHIDLFQQSFSLLEEGVKAFAIAWPCLEELWLCNRQPVGRMGDNGLSLTSLQIFAAHCPRLRNLHLPINADTIQVSPLVRPPKHSDVLKLLVLVIPPAQSPWPEQEILSAARYVVKVFPSLDWDRCLSYHKCGCDLFSGVGKSVIKEAGAIARLQQGGGEPGGR